MIHDYVAQTNPCFEAIAAGNLEAKGFEVYLPTVIEDVRYGRRLEKRETVMVPLFPGYIFVRFDRYAPDQRWRDIAKVRGVRGLLQTDAEHPTPLPMNALTQLKARFLAGEFTHRVDVTRVNAGDGVTVVQGAFEGHRGVCLMSRGDRVRILLDLLGGAVPVNLTAQMVRRAG